MRVQRAPQVSIDDETTFVKSAGELFQNHAGAAFASLLGLILISGGIGFFLAELGAAKTPPQPNNELVAAQTALQNERRAAEETKVKLQNELSAARTQADADLKALKAKYDYDLVYYNDQVKKYMDMMGKSPESKKRETFLNLYITYQQISEIAARSALPMTADEKQKASENLRKFIAANLDMSSAEQERYGLSFIIQPKSDGYDLSVDCGGIRRAIPAEVTAPLKEKIKSKATGTQASESGL